MENQQMVTVKKLREQLEKLEQAGLADALLWYRDFDDVDHPIAEGVYDTNEKTVILG